MLKTTRLFRQVCLLAALLFAVAPAAAEAQVFQQGTITTGHAPSWSTNNVIRDAGSAANGNISELGIKSSSGVSLGIISGATTSAYTQFGVGVVPGTGVQITDTAMGGATHVPMNFVVNGNTTMSITDTNVLVNGVPIGGATIPNSTLLGNTSGIPAIATAQGPAAITTLLGLGTAAFVNTGNSGATIPLLNAANTWGATQTFPTNSLTLTELPQIASGTVLGNVTGSAGNVTATPSPVLGVNGGTGGSIVLAGATSGNVTIRVGNAAGTNGIFQLPTSNGSGGQFLQTDGAGATSWQNVAGGGTVNAGTSGQMAYYASSTNAVSGNTLANISSGALTLGLASTTAGSLVLEGGTSGKVTLNVPAIAGTTNFTLPGSNGTSGQFLQTDGSGVTSWQSTSGTGTVNSGTAGQLTYYAGSGTTVSGNANATVSGGALTLGQSGTAGSVVLNGSSTGTLTIKTPAAAGSGSVLTLPAGTTDFSSTGGTSQVVKQTSSGGAFTVATLACTDLSNGATGCSTATGTSGATIPLLNAANTWSGVQTFNNSAIKMVGSSSGATTITSNNAGASNFTLTLPAVSGTAITTGDSNTVALGMIAQSGANTMLGNWSGSTANVAANAMPSCSDTGGNHLNYVSGTGVTCGTSSGSAGAMALVSTQTASGSADLRFTGLSATPNTYMMQCNGIVPAATDFAKIQVGTGGTPTWQTSSYAYTFAGAKGTGTADTGGATGASAIHFNDNSISNAGTVGFGLTVWINNVGSSTLQKPIFGNYQFFNADTSVYASGSFGGQWAGATTALTAIRFIMNSGNITSGQCSLYSLSN